jgi:1-acyl-sn-glycerol-3-phosphate acyltransferase
VRSTGCARAGERRHPDPDVIAEPANERLLQLLREFLAETRSMPQQRVRVALDSAFDRDLGVDSLGRAELLLRVERAFGVRLPEGAITRAATPRDLLRELESAAAGATAGGTTGAHAGPGAGTTTGAASDTPAASRATPTDRAAPGPSPEPRAGAEAPEHCATLQEVLDWHVAAHPERVHMTLLADGEQGQSVRYGELADAADAVAAGLQNAGVEPGDAIALMLPTAPSFFHAFLGVLRVGAIPIPIYPPFRWSQLEEHLQRQVGILASAGAKMLITVEEARRVAGLMQGQVASLERILTAEEIARPGERPVRPRVSGSDIAFVQYTSGSTGNPKGVTLTHDNLLANLRAMARTVGADSSDVFVSWLPLYHDMGLIGAWFGSLVFGMHLVVMPPVAFLARPTRWLRTIHRYRGTISAAPNFAYEICAAKLADSDLEGLDLSSWRWAFNGAEPVSPDTLARFTARFAPYGFDPLALAPVYGLAESAVGLAFPPPRRGPRVDLVDREALTASGIATPARADDSAPLRLVACGLPLRGHDIRVVDATSGAELPERHEGRVEFRGPSATSGYFHNPEATRALIRDGWHDTGDVGYLANGELFVTGRVKDMIIRAGHNIYPYELEQAVGALPGVRKGCVAVFGVPDERTATEKVVVVAEVRRAADADLSALRSSINDLATSLIGGPADDVVLTPAHAVLKTSSGKIRRLATRELYLHGRSTAPDVPVWRQLATLGLRGALGRVRRAVRRAAAFAWSTYVWALVAVLGLAGIAVIVAVPTFEPRRRALRALARLLLRLTGLPVGVEGIDHATGPDPVIAVCNHASYVDGILLFAVLPPRFVYVTKREFEGTALGWLLARGVGVKTVERFDPSGSLESARDAIALARAGTSLVYFAEGTFRRPAGLMPFRMGAFAASVESGLPVVPVALRGTRNVLRAEQWVPARAPVTVSIGAPLVAVGSDWSAAVALRDRTRAWILERCGEPDAGAG